MINTYDLPDMSSVAPEELTRAQEFSPLVTSWLIKNGLPGDVQAVAQFQEMGGLEALKEPHDARLENLKNLVLGRVVSTTKEVHLKTVEDRARAREIKKRTSP